MTERPASPRFPDAPGQVFADSAYGGETFRAAVRAKGETPRIVAAHMWGREEQETLARLEVFGTWKQSYGLRRIRRVGLAKAALQIRLTAIAYNIRRTLGVLAAA